MPDGRRQGGTPECARAGRFLAGGHQTCSTDESWIFQRTPRGATPESMLGHALQLGPDRGRRADGGCAFGANGTKPAPSLPTPRAPNSYSGDGRAPLLIRRLATAAQQGTGPADKLMPNEPMPPMSFKTPARTLPNTKRRAGAGAAGPSAAESDERPFLGTQARPAIAPPTRRNMAWRWSALEATVSRPSAREGTGPRKASDRDDGATACRARTPEIETTALRPGRTGQTAIVLPAGRWGAGAQSYRKQWRRQRVLTPQGLAASPWPGPNRAHGRRWALKHGSAHQGGRRVEGPARPGARVPRR